MTMEHYDENDELTEEGRKWCMQIAKAFIEIKRVSEKKS